MADIKLLHWNIQTYADKKTSNINAGALINYVAHVIVGSKANIVSLLEIHTFYADMICKLLIAAIDTINKVPPKSSKWSYRWVDSGEREAYVVLYQAGHEFALLNATKSKKPIYGLSTQAKVTEDKGTLNFNSTSSDRGGRTPFYISFETTDTKKKFTVVAYHAMYSGYTPYGVSSAGLLAQNKAVNDTGVTVALDSSLPAGDYNVHFELNEKAYANLLALPSAQATNERTSLKATTPPDGFTDPKEYRSSAYDNIFFYKSKKPYASAPVGHVVDLINLSTLKPPGAGLLAKAITAFDRDGIRNEMMLGDLPPAEFEDAWHVVRDSISDHLPVFVSVTI